MYMQTSNELLNNVASDETPRELDDQELNQVVGGTSGVKLFLGKLWVAVGTALGADFDDDSGTGDAVGVRG